MRSEEDDLSQEELASAAALRPKTRGDCEDGPRPCPWAGCRYHLYLDVSARGSLKINFPHLEIEDMAATCALDEARYGMMLAEVGRLMNLTRERARQIETKSLVKMNLTGKRLLR